MVWLPFAGREPGVIVGWGRLIGQNDLVPSQDYPVFSLERDEDLARLQVGDLVEHVIPRNRAALQMILDNSPRPLPGALPTDWPGRFEPGVEYTDGNGTWCIELHAGRVE